MFQGILSSEKSLSMERIEGGQVWEGVGHSRLTPGLMPVYHRCSFPALKLLPMKPLSFSQASSMFATLPGVGFQHLDFFSITSSKHDATEHHGCSYPPGLLPPVDMLLLQGQALI